MPESPINKLTKAILAFDEDMAKLHDEGKSMAGDLIRTADSLAVELENDIKLVLREILEDLNKTVQTKSEELRKKYLAEKEDKVRLVRFNAEQNMDKAVNRILEELRKILSEV
jgi:polyhydroxyalkanoate synthesis regulator phasin